MRCSALDDIFRLKRQRTFGLGWTTDDTGLLQEKEREREKKRVDFQSISERKTAKFYRATVRQTLVRWQLKGPAAKLCGARDQVHFIFRRVKVERSLLGPRQPVLRKYQKKFASSLRTAIPRVAHGQAGAGPKRAHG